jgi:hypothetical protein
LIGLKHIGKIRANRIIEVREEFQNEQQALDQDCSFFECIEDLEEIGMQTTTIKKLLKDNILQLLHLNHL